MQPIDIANFLASKTPAEIAIFTTEVFHYLHPQMTIQNQENTSIILENEGVMINYEIGQTTNNKGICKRKRVPVPT